MRDSTTFSPTFVGENQRNHQFLNWWQQMSTGHLHLDGFESHLKIKTRYPHGYLVFMAEDEGFEPPQTESESGVLPLHKSSMRNSYIICNVPKKSSPFFKFLQILFSVPLRSGNRSTQEYSSPACPDADSSGNRPHLPAS